MKKYYLIFALILLPILVSCASNPRAKSTIKVATFNVSIEATNYLSRAEISADPSAADIVVQHLRTGEQSQLKNIAEIIQRERPDVLLLNEFDYLEDANNGIELFIKNYLSVAQNNQLPINYAHYFIAPVNTGISTPFDLDNNGKRESNGADALGFGYYPGQYGMAILSRFPIDIDNARTLQNFLWKDMPNALKTTKEDGSPWYSEAAWSQLPLSSKSHWDVPIKIDQNYIHIIAAHPTPPTFDGPEDRNGKRNHDEIRLISDYLSDRSYLYDDTNSVGGLTKESRFVVLGDLNSSPKEGDSKRAAIKSLLSHPLVNDRCIPNSVGGQQARSDNSAAKHHTAAWGLRVDYALPSKYGLTVNDCGMFWPSKQDELHRLIASRGSSSDHRLVWVELTLD